MDITVRANKWITDSGDDTKELREAAEVMVGLMVEISTWKDIANDIRLERDRLASDALTALAGTVCTPVEGYVLAPRCLKANISELVRENAALKLQLSGRTYCHSDEAVEARCKELEAANANMERLCDKRQKTIDRQAMRTKEWKALIDGLRGSVKEATATGRREAFEEAATIAENAMNHPRSYDYITAKIITEAIRKAAGNE